MNELTYQVPPRLRRPFRTVKGVQALLLMVLSQWPTLRVINSWTPEQRDQVEAWAAAMILAANDNPIKVPPRPGIVDPWWNIAWPQKQKASSQPK